MNRGLYIATTSLLQNKKKMDTVSNNLANVNTTGFKKDGVISESFHEELLSRINDKPDYKNRETFKGVNVKKDEYTYTLSINKGFFKTETPEGIAHSKQMKFRVDEQGYLKTFHRNAEGNLESDVENYVLGKNGRIQVEGQNIDIDSNGNVLSDGKKIDNLITFAPPHVIGTISGGARVDRVYTDFSQGNIMKTGNKLDFALKGDGFFKVYTEDGDMYTRDGSFTLNTKGELITGEGHFVLGTKGTIIEGRDFSINEQGEIIKNGEIVDKLDIVKLENVEALRKVGDNLYKIEDNIEPKEVAFDGQVLKGHLENSNVDTIKEMVTMIELMRNYESSQRVIKTQDEMLGKAINEIARL